MLNTKTIARPYTNAVFDVASQKGELDSWENFLSVMSHMVKDSNFRTIEYRAASGYVDLEEFMIESMNELIGKLSVEQENVIKLLVHNGRINIVHDVKVLFEQRVRETKGTFTARIFSRFPLRESEEKLLESKLAQKFGKKCGLEVVIDPTVIGGIIIKIGDSVIDLSMEGRLEAFAKAIS